jgi:hypothetical protein
MESRKSSNEIKQLERSFTKILDPSTEPNQKRRLQPKIELYLPLALETFATMEQSKQISFIVRLYLLAITNHANPAITQQSHASLDTLESLQDIDPIVHNGISTIKISLRLQSVVLVDEFLTKNGYLQQLTLLRDAYNNRIRKLSPLFKKAPLGQRLIRLEYALELLSSCSWLLGFSIHYHGYKGFSQYDDKCNAFTNQCYSLLGYAQDALSDKKNINHSLFAHNIDSMAKTLHSAVARIKQDPYLTNPENTQYHNLIIKAQGQFTSRITNLESTIEHLQTITQN